MLVMTEHVVPSWDGQVARLELRGLREEDAGRAINRVYTITEQVTFTANKMTQWKKCFFNWENSQIFTTACDAGQSLIDK